MVCAVSRPSVRTDPSRLSNGCASVATTGPPGVSAEIPRVSSEDEPSRSTENDTRFLTRGPAPNALMRTCVPALAPLATALVGVLVAWSALPWAWAIIIGGAVLLLAPLILQLFPDSFVDGRAGLLVFAGFGAILSFAVLLHA